MGSGPLVNAALFFLFLTGLLCVLVGFVLLAFLLIDPGTSFLYGGIIIAVPSYCGLLIRHINPEGNDQ